MYTIRQTPTSPIEYQLWNGRQRDSFTPAAFDTCNPFYFAWYGSIRHPHLALRLWNAAAIIAAHRVSLTGNDSGIIGTVTNNTGRVYEVTKNDHGFTCGYNDPPDPYNGKPHRHPCPDHEHNSPQYCKHQLAVLLACKLTATPPAEDDPADHWHDEEASPPEPARPRFIAQPAKAYRDMSEAERDEYNAQQVLNEKRQRMNRYQYNQRLQEASRHAAATQ